MGFCVEWSNKIRKNGKKEGGSKERVSVILDGESRRWCSHFCLFLHTDFCQHSLQPFFICPPLTLTPQKNQYSLRKATTITTTTLSTSQDILHDIGSR